MGINPQSGFYRFTVTLLESAGASFISNASLLIGMREPSAAGPSIGLVYKRTAVTTTPYAIAITDEYLGVDTSVARTLNLPAAGMVQGQTYTVADETGNAMVNNITLQATGGFLVDGWAYWLIDTNYAVMSVIWTGTAWKVR